MRRAQAQSRGDPARLVRHGAKCSSQADEDGIVAEIFRRIGTGHRTFVEFGAGTGLENNTAHLLLQGWHGAWIEGDPANVEVIRGKYRHFLEAGRRGVGKALLLPDNVDRAGASLGVTGAIDLLSVDIDGNDLALIEALDCIKPRVVVAEYNARYYLLPWHGGHPEDARADRPFPLVPAEEA